jgi:hypothetical protein
MKRLSLCLAILLAACDRSHPSLPQGQAQAPVAKPPAPWPLTLTDRRDGFIEFVRVVPAGDIPIYRHGITLFKSGKFYDWVEGQQTFRDCSTCVGYGSYTIEDTTIVLRYEFMYFLRGEAPLPTETIGSIRGDTLRLAFPSWMGGVYDVYLEDRPSYTLNQRVNFP